MLFTTLLYTKRRTTTFLPKLEGMDIKKERPRLTPSDLTKEQKQARARIKTQSNAFCVALGAHIARVRVQCGMSQDRVALETGLSRAGLSRIEAGKVDPQASTLERIAEVLQISLADLISVKKRDGWFTND